jgi:hypothetical protein
MGAIDIRPRVQGFQGGGVQDLNLPPPPTTYSITPRPMPAAPALAPQEQPPAEPGVVSATPYGVGSIFAQPGSPPTPGVNTAPGGGAPAGDGSTGDGSPQLNRPPDQPSFDEDIEADKARRADTEILQDPQRLLSHAGDHNFLVPHPGSRANYLDKQLQQDPEWQQYLQKKELARQYLGGMTAAERNHTDTLLHQMQTNVLTRMNKSYTDEVQAWRQQESEQQKQYHGRDLVGQSMVEATAAAEDARKRLEASIDSRANPTEPGVQAASPQQTATDKLLSAASNKEVMSPGMFNQSVTTLMHLNPTLNYDVAAQYIEQLASPKGSKAAFNGRPGRYGANYKLRGYDVDHNVFIDVNGASSPLLVSTGLLGEVNNARNNAYNLSVDAARKRADLAKKPTSKGILQDAADLAHPKRTPAGTAVPGPTTTVPPM